MLNKRKMICGFCLFVFGFIIVWVTTGQESVWALLSNLIVARLLIFLFIVSLLIVSFLLLRLSRLSGELKGTFQFINHIKEDRLHSEQMKTTTPIVKSINQAIANIAKEQKEQILELNRRTKQLDEKNEELNEAYLQLESSFGQLQAALEQLNDSEKRYHTLVVNIPDIVLTLDTLGNITYASRACQDVLKFRRRDIVGKPFQCLLNAPEEYDFSKLCDNIKKTGEQRMNISLRKADNSIIQTEIKFTLGEESGGFNSIQAIVRDVTEQRHIENALLENNQRLETLNRFSHKLASAMELPEIYKLCVNTVVNEFNFFGCIYFMMGKNERFYRIMNYSGDYFEHSKDTLEQFSFIHRKVKALSNKECDGIILDFDNVPQYLAMKHKNVRATTKYKQAYLQELRIGGETAGLILVLSKTDFIKEEIDILRSIGHTTAVAVENTTHLIESKKNYVQTIDALVAAIEAKDQYTRGHSQRVSGFAVKIAQKMGLSQQHEEEIRIAGILHDIGKIGISDRILLKKGPLTKEEYDEIKKHPAISNKILYPIGLSDRVLKAVAFHHERFDGKGYPFGLTNESLGVEPQIIAVADAFDAMTSSRPYRAPLTRQMALRELIENKGTQFHPKIVEMMIEIQVGESYIV